MFWFVTITPYGKDLEPNVLYSNSPFLIGESTPEDKITEAKQKRWIFLDKQISLID